MDFTRTYGMVAGALKQHPRYVDVRGGTRSGKTFAVLQCLALMALGDRKPTVTSVISESLPHLKRGAIRDFMTIMQGDGLWRDDAWSKVDSIYTFGSGSVLEFFGADNAGKVHGAARDRLFINEAQNVDWEIARQLFVRTRKTVVFDYNPICSFWATDQIAPREDCISLLSTYRDNTHLTPEQVREIEYNKGDANWWRVYGEGLVGEMTSLYFANVADCVGSPDPSVREVYLGIDWAAGGGGDYTVLTAVNARGHMTGMWRTNELEPMAQVQWLADIILGIARDRTIKRVVAERNSLGAVYISSLRKALPGVPVTEFMTTNESKREIIESLQRSLSLKTIRLLDNAELLKELRQYQMVINPRTRTVTFEGAGAHDDCVMSLAFAWWAYRKTLGDVRISLV